MDKKIVGITQLIIGIIVALIGIYYVFGAIASTRLENYVILLSGVFFLLTAIPNLKKEK